MPTRRQLIIGAIASGIGYLLPKSGKANETNLDYIPERIDYRNETPHDYDYYHILIDGKSVAAVYADRIVGVAIIDLINRNGAFTSNANGVCRAIVRGAIEFVPRDRISSDLGDHKSPADAYAHQQMLLNKGQDIGLMYFDDPKTIKKHKELFAKMNWIENHCV